MTSVGAVVVDARGLSCPQPVIRLARAARAAHPGTEITVLWTDPAARYDIAAWARMRGHRVTATAPLPPADSQHPTSPEAHSTTVVIEEWSGFVAESDGS